MKDELFDEAASLLNGLEEKIDEAINHLTNNELENPFNRRAGQRDDDIRRLSEILDEFKSARDAALEYLQP